uniref:Uncharacterized protein n=1 Tax=Oryctolagus cuniculus TaxID=9986 RepID=A0A5F9DR46_RABIT
IAGCPGPHAPSAAGAQHRSAVHTTSVSTSRLLTAQMATIRDAFTSSSAAAPPAAAATPATPAAREDAAAGACPPSTSDSSTVAVAVSAGSPWSFTSTSSRWRAKSASSRLRVVLISPVYSPTRNGRRARPTMPFCTFTSSRSPPALDATRNRRGTSSASGSPRSCARRPTNVPCWASSGTE